MELNGHRLEASELDAAQAMRALSMRTIGEQDFAAWLRTCTSELEPTGRGARRKRAARPAGPAKRRRRSTRG